MANKIQVKRGIKSKMPLLDVGEPGLCTDTSEFYIGGNTNNIKIYNSSEIDTIVNNISIQNFFEKIKNNKSKLIGHRGLNAIYPENTCLAIEKACEMGMFGVELDIIKTSDGKYCVIHDDTVDRTTNGTGTVENLTSSYIKGLRIDGGNGNPAYYSPLKVPFLEDILSIIQIYNTIAFIEMKGTNYDYDKVLQTIYNFKLEEKVCLLSFNENHMVQMRNRDKNILIALNGNLTKENVDKLSTWGNSIISTPISYVTDELVKYAHSKNVPVISYSATSYTVFRQQIKLGIDLMTTDFVFQGGDY